MSEQFENMDSFEFPCDPDKLPTSAELPLGELILEGKSMVFERSKENVTGETHPKTGLLKASFKRIAVIQATVDEPSDLRGVPYTHRFYLGTDLDPQAAKEVTWSSNPFCRNFMKLRKAARIGGKTPNEIAAAFPGQKFGVSVRLEPASGGFPAKHIARDFWEPGTKQVRLTGEAAAGHNGPPPMPRHANGNYSNND